MATSFFGGSFFGGEFFNTPGPEPQSGLAPAGRSSSSRRKKRVIIGDRLYELDSLRDVELLLKRVVRSESEPATKAAKARVRVVDRIRVVPDEVEAAPVPVPSAEVDWSSLWVQLALQDRAYAEILERVIARQEEDDLEAILLLL